MPAVKQATPVTAAQVVSGEAPAVRAGSVVTMQAAQETAPPVVSEEVPAAARPVPAVRGEAPAVKRGGAGGLGEVLAVKWAVPARGVAVPAVKLAAPARVAAPGSGACGINLGLRCDNGTDVLLGIHLLERRRLRKAAAHLRAGWSVLL